MSIKTSNYFDRSIMIAVCVAVIIFVLLPFVMVFLEAFFQDGTIDLAGFTRFFNQDIHLLKNSLKVGILTTVISTIVSVFIGIYAVSYGNRKTIENILLITMISPPFVTSLSYINLFGRRGYITHGLFGLTLNTYGMWGIVLMQSVGYISLNALLVMSSVSRIDEETIQSARDLGARSDHIVMDIILPSIKNTLVVVSMLTFVRSIADFGTPAIIGGNFSTMATEAYLSMIAYGDINYAAVINTILFVPSLIAFIFYRRFVYEERSEGKGSETTVKLEKKGFFRYITLFFSILFLIWLLLNYLSILFSAFTKKRMGVPYFTLQNIIDTKPYITGTFLRSIVYSLISGAGAALIGLLIGYYIVLRKIKIMRFIDFIATIPYIIPGSFFGIGYILAFKHEPFRLTGTAAIVVLNMLFRALPFSSKIGTEAASEVNPETVNSVRDLGGTHLSVIKDVMFKESSSGLFMSFANGFRSSMTTIGSIIFLVYPGKKVATLVMFDVIQSSKYNVGSVIACIIILITLTVNLLARRLIKSSGKKSREKNVSNLRK